MQIKISLKNCTSLYALAGFRPNSEIIGNFRKIENFYGHFIKRKK